MAVNNAEGQDQIFVTILVVVIIAAIAAVKYYGKNRKKKKQNKKNQKKKNEQNNTKYKIDEKQWENLQQKFNNITEKSKIKKQTTTKQTAKTKINTVNEKYDSKIKPKKTNQKNVAGGMELLSVEFLLAKTAKVTEIDKKDVEMRQMAFNELARRNELNKMAGEILKDYAVNGDNLYGKTIQCLAMKTLAQRTIKT